MAPNSFSACSRSRPTSARSHGSKAQVRVPGLVRVDGRADLAHAQAMRTNPPRPSLPKSGAPWLAALLLAVLPTPSSAAQATGLCVLVTGDDLRVKDAVVVVSSGRQALDESRRSDVIGMQTPVPVSWSSDFWTGLTVEDPATSEASANAPPDCGDLNRQLCGALNCRQAGSKQTR